ncbi:MAG: WbqC family protein [Candidatus Marinimicrobia bacterium]|nr:WbqC family protein [Candidatus Neomarinimicrobiota bacterium]
MICSIHQPQTFPWIGYFAKIFQSDIFVILDNVQFKKNEWQNRNRLKTPAGWQWLTVPVIHRFGQLISEVKVNNTVNWRKKHIQTLKTFYGKAPFFKIYFPEIEELYQKQWESLADFNLAGIKWILDKLAIQTPVKIASDLKELQKHSEVSPDERLILITKIMKADSYLSGAGGINYLKTDLFPNNSLNLIFQKFEHPVYRQLHGKFVSYLSILDLLLNEGPYSLNIIKGGIR